MKRYQIVLDTNVVISALRSVRGASHKLLLLIGREKFDINVSVGLILEYEEVAKRLIGEISLTEREIDDIIDYLCAAANRRKISYLWRPFLKDARDDMVLELAVTAGCDYIVTCNAKDFWGVEYFGIAVVTPKEFLKKIGELS